MFSILIPTFNNIKYLECCINSIKKNSKYNHEIIPHVNIGDDGTLEYLNKHKIDFLDHGDDNINPVPSDRLVLFPRTEGISSTKIRNSRTI